MLIKIEEPGSQITLNDVKKLEKELEISLPKQYVDFLVHYNGGLPIPNYYPVEEHQENILEMQVFFGIKRKIESSCLDWNFHEYKGYIPNNLFPIGCSSGNDLICLSLSGKDKGAVLFWDLMDEAEQSSYSNVYKIANSFSEFLMCLCEFED
ncbi:MAG TPA: SMI1/KNR4 family protein [Thiotrichaceae bacterium]|nr:SMI1/KNR4 family protein [Thiotrichaceae bacterium]